MEILYLHQGPLDFSVSRCSLREATATFRSQTDMAFVLEKVLHAHTGPFTSPKRLIHHQVEISHFSREDRHGSIQFCILGCNSQPAALLNPNCSGLTATRMTVSRTRPRARPPPETEAGKTAPEQDQAQKGVQGQRNV